MNHGSGRLLATRLRRLATTSPWGIVAALTLLVSALSGLTPGSGVVVAQSATTNQPSASPAASLCPVDSNNVPVAAADAGQVFTLADGSSASYSVDEVLTTQGNNTAVGTTNAIIGTILLSDDGAPLPCSTFYVDLRTLTTDNDRRDGQVQQVLQTNDYPLGKFILTSVTGLDGALPAGKEQSLKLVGDLTIHNVTRTVTWDAKVTLDDKSLTGSATTNVSFADFDMKAPVIGPVASIEDEFQLSVQIAAAKSN